MGTKSREGIYGASVCASASRAAKACKQADRLACEARTATFTFRPAPPSQCWVRLNAGYLCVEVQVPGLQHPSGDRFGRCAPTKKRRPFTSWSVICAAASARSFRGTARVDQIRSPSALEPGDGRTLYRLAILGKSASRSAMDSKTGTAHAGATVMRLNPKGHFSGQGRNGEYSAVLLSSKPRCGTARPSGSDASRQAGRRRCGPWRGISGLPRGLPPATPL